MNYQLSILIPARNEMFLRQTIEDILEKSEADTEVIAVLDGQLPIEGIPQHDRLNMILLPESIGQRASTNLACRLSKAKYVMKVDAHCSFDKGFDRKLLNDIKDNWTIVPIMKNLHVFDWVCVKCGNKRYQGPSGMCSKCGGAEERNLVWKAKKNPNSTSYRFDPSLKFQYWTEYKKNQKGKLVETMSLQGSCFMMTRRKYWGLNICDESWGSWGNQGTEVALKTWLSGGRVIVDKNTWYAHMFRTQGGDFSFPYSITEKQVEKARKKSRDIFLNDKWNKAVHPLSWLIKKFNPPGWGNPQGMIANGCQT
jgi:ribosomal protein L37E